MYRILNSNVNVFTVLQYDMRIQGRTVGDEALHGFANKVFICLQWVFYRGRRHLTLVMALTIPHSGAFTSLI